MATKRKHEDDSIAARLTKRLKTDVIEAEQKLDVVWKGLNEQLGDVQYPPATEEEVDQWEMKAKEALGKIPRFDRLRFKFPPHLREYLKLTGKAFKDYTDHSPRKELLQSFYGGFIADFDKLLEITAEEVIDVKNHAKTEKLGQRIYLFCIYGRSESCSILVNCDSQDEENFGAVYFFNLSATVDSNPNDLFEIPHLAASLADFFKLLTTSMRCEGFPGLTESSLEKLPTWLGKDLGRECEIDTFKDASWKLIDASNRSKPIKELIESEKGAVYVHLCLEESGSESTLVLKKDSYGDLMLRIVGTPDKDNTHVGYDHAKPVLFMFNRWTGLGHMASLKDAKEYLEGGAYGRTFIEYPVLKSILGDKLDRVKIDQFWVNSTAQQS